MSSPLDEISYKLGEITAGIAILQKRAEKRDLQMDGFAASLGEIKVRMKPLADDVKFMKPQVEHYKTWRKRAALVGSALVVAFSTLGGVIGEWALRKYTGT